MLPIYLNTKHPPGNSLQRCFKLIILFLFIIFLIPFAVKAQPNITRVEYYIDTDPGFGSATTLSITPGIDIQNQVIAINPASVTQGVHRLYVRAKDANESWSLT